MLLTPLLARFTHPNNSERCERRDHGDSCNAADNSPGRKVLLEAPGACLKNGEVDVFLTGGWRAAVRGEILSVQEFPDLVLSGIGIAAIEISGL